MKKTKQNSLMTGIVIGALAACGLGVIVYILSNKERSQTIKQKALSFKDKTEAKFKDKSEGLKDKSDELKLKADHWKDGASAGAAKSKIELLKQAFKAGKEAAIEKKSELSDAEETN